MNETFNYNTYLENRLKFDFTLGGVGYKGLGTSYNEYLYKIRRFLFEKEIDKLISLDKDFRKEKILDVGSGTGFYLNLWLSRGLLPKQIIGSDLTDISVLKLNENFFERGIKIHKLDIGKEIESDDLKNDRFLCISAFDILFHIVDDVAYEQAFKNISDFLFVGGYFIFTENFLKKNRISQDHQVSRTESEIRDLLKKNRFSVEKIVPVFFFMNYPIDGNRLLKLIWRLFFFPLKKFNFLGIVYGLLLMPFEILFTRLPFIRGSGTKMIICRKF